MAAFLLGVIVGIVLAVVAGVLLLSLSMADFRLWP
jgi:hypothetical protein